MTDEQKAKCHEIADHYGEEHQMLKAVEEMAELAQVITKTIHGDTLHEWDYDIIERHGKRIPDGFYALDSFDSAKEWLENHPEHEGLVWWFGGTPVCKLKRSDFGLKFPVKEEINDSD